MAKKLKKKDFKKFLSKRLGVKVKKMWKDFSKLDVRKKDLKGLQKPIYNRYNVWLAKDELASSGYPYSVYSLIEEKTYHVRYRSLNRVRHRPADSYVSNRHVDLQHYENRVAPLADRIISFIFEHGAEIGKAAAFAIGWALLTGDDPVEAAIGAGVDRTIAIKLSGGVP